MFSAPAVPGGDQRSDDALVSPGDEERAGVPIEESCQHLGIVRSRAVAASPGLPQLQHGAEILLPAGPISSPSSGPAFSSVLFSFGISGILTAGGRETHRPEPNSIVPWSSRR
jgi:hypothetical protein